MLTFREFSLIFVVAPILAPALGFIVQGVAGLMLGMCTQGLFALMGVFLQGDIVRTRYNNISLTPQSKLTIYNLPIRVFPKGCSGTSMLKRRIVPLKITTNLSCPHCGTRHQYPVEIEEDGKGGLLAKQPLDTLECIEDCFSDLDNRGGCGRDFAIGIEIKQPQVIIGC